MKAMPDEDHMARAIALAEGGRGTTSPNPMVGAVVVDEAGRVVGEGYHRFVGGPHAESVALADAGSAAAGATLHVTLEPCRHHGRTPPCTDAIVAARIAHVVVAQLDPNEKMAGASVAALEDAGIGVLVGVRSSEAEAQIAAYRHHRATGRPMVTLKLATTIDGRIAAPDGTSRWISGRASREDAHELRRESDAIVVGSGTVIVDDPALTVRTAPPPPRQPLRVVLDARGRVGADADVFAQPGRAVVVTTSDHRRGDVDSIVVSAGDGGGVDLEAMLVELGAIGVMTLLVEGGAFVAGSFLRQALVDRLVVYIGSAVAGGDDARPVLAGAAFASIDEFVRPRLDSVERIGDDVKLVYSLTSAAPTAGSEDCD